jgi:hypothetical protein
VVVELVVEALTQDLMQRLTLAAVAEEQKILQSAVFIELVTEVPE